MEDGESEVIQQNYANVLVAKEGNETNEALLALAEAMKSEQVKTFIAETYEGAVVPLFSGRRQGSALKPAKGNDSPWNPHIKMPVPERDRHLNI